MTADAEGELRLWALPPPPSRLLHRHAGPARGLAISFDGSWVASTGGETLALTSLTGGKGWQQPLRGAYNALAFSPTGQALASTSGDGSVLLDAASGAHRPIARHAGRATHVGFAARGASVASVGSDQRLRITPIDGSPGLELGGADHSYAALVATASGARVATAGTSLTVFGDEPTTLGAAPDLAAVAMTPEGSHVLALYADRDPELWDLERGTRVALPPVTGPVSNAALAPGATHAALALGGGGVLLIELATGEQRELHAGIRVDALAFSPSGTLLASANGDGTVGVWNLEAGRGRVLLGHGAAVARVVFTPDGALVSSSRDGEVRLWPDPGESVVPADPDQLRAWIARQTNAAPIDDAAP